jgi:hypothetical protein
MRQEGKGSGPRGIPTDPERFPGPLAHPVNDLQEVSMTGVSAQRISFAVDIRTLELMGYGNVSTPLGDVYDVIRSGRGLHLTSEMLEAGGYTRSQARNLLAAIDLGTHSPLAWESA